MTKVCRVCKIPKMNHFFSASEFKRNCPLCIKCRKEKQDAEKIDRREPLRTPRGASWRSFCINPEKVSKLIDEGTFLGYDVYQV